MKKLTAGIFATLLAVVSVDGAYAAIASKGYVDEKVGTVTTELGNKADKTELGKYATTEVLTSGLAGKLDTTGTAAKATADAAGNVITDTYATKTELNAAEKIANRVTTVSDASDDTHYPTAKAVWDVVQAETADIASTTDLTALKGRVDTAESDIDSIQGTMGTYGDIVTKNASDFATAAQGAKADTALQKSGQLTQGNLLTTDASGNIIDAGAKGALASKNTVSAADIAANAVTTEKIADGNVTKAKLASDVQTSLGKADSALQQADLADYAKTADVASTYETKENAASTYETKANASATYETKTNAAATYATKEEIADLATDENLAKKQDKTDNSLATTNKTVVGAINEVKTTADGANTAAKAAQTAADSKLPTATYNSQVGEVSATNMGTSASTVVAAIKEVAGEAAAAQSTASSANTAAGAAQKAAEAAQATANAAIPKPDGECSDPDNKCVLTFNNSAYAWEVIERGAAE